MNDESRPQEIIMLPIAEIELPTNGRRIDTDAVRIIAESIRVGGLQSPILVNTRGGRYRLIYGQHRIEGMRTAIGAGAVIACRLVDVSDDEARRMTLTENFARSDLTALERSDAIAEYAALMKEGLRKESANPKGGRPGENRAVARALKIDEAEVRSSKIVAALAPEAKARATELNLDDNRAALLEAAKAPTPKAQVRAIERRFAPVHPRAPTPAQARKKSEAAAIVTLDGFATPAEFASWIMKTNPQSLSQQARMLHEAATILEAMQRNGARHGEHQAEH